MHLLDVDDVDVRAAKLSIKGPVIFSHAIQYIIIL